MLTQTQKVAIRRHLGVPFAGTAQAGRLYGWRFTWYNEDLEYRMNNLQPSEEQLLTGYTLGTFRIDGRPAVGDTISFSLVDPVLGTLSASYTVQASDFALPPNSVNPSESSPLYSIALNSVLALNAVIASRGYNAVASMPADLVSPQYLSPYFSEVIITGPSASAFTLSASQSGSTNLFVAQPAVVSPVSATITDPSTSTAQACFGYIQLCDVLAMSQAQTSASLSFVKADVVTFRHDEQRARKAVYREYCHQLESVLGGRDYVDKFGSRATGGATA